MGDGKVVYFVADRGRGNRSHLVRERVAVSELRSELGVESAHNNYWGFLINS